ncbi:GTP-binding protein [Candidatus Vidania fulgoroideorum]
MKKIYVVKRGFNLIEYLKKRKILKKNILKKNIDLKKYLRSKKIIFYYKTIKKRLIISLIGNSDNGKTTITKRFCNFDNFINEYNNITQCSNAYYSKFNDVDFILIDNPGHNDFDYIKKKSIDISNLVIIVLNSCSFLEKNTENFIKYLIIKKKDFIFIINKIDICKNSKIIYNSTNNFLKKYNLKKEFFEISAKKKKGFNELFKYIKEFKFKKFSYSFVINSFFNNKKLLTKLILNNNYLCVGKKIYDEENNLVCVVKKIYKDNISIDIAFPIEIVTILGFKKIFSFGKKIFFNKKNKLKNLKKINYENFLEYNFLSPKKKNIFLISDNINYINSFIKIFNSNSIFSEYNLIGKKIINNSFNNLIFKNCKYIYYGTKEYNNCNVKSFYSIYEIYKYFEKFKRVDFNFKNNFLIKKIFFIDKKRIYGCYIKKGSIKLGCKYYLFRNNKLLKKDIEIISIKHLGINKKTISFGKECGIIIKGSFLLCENDSLFI